MSSTRRWPTPASPRSSWPSPKSRSSLQGWLFGALAEAGIEIPDKFDIKGIIKLILSLLGLTWNAIRARIPKVIPEPVMKVIETSVDFVQAILSEGLVGLWKWIAAKLSDLKETVMGQIREFVVTKIITAGITWLISTQPGRGVHQSLAR